MSADAAPRGKSLLSLAWPLVISFTARSLLTSIDIPYASRVGDAAVAAIGLFFPLEFVFIAFWVGTSSALTSHLSKAMGERNAGRLQQLVSTATRIVLALVAGFLALAAGVYFIAPHLGLDPEVAAAFRLYAPVAMIGIAVFGFWSTIPDSIVKAHHDTKSTMVAGLISGLGNFGLNTLFVFGFEWGLLGIALATGLARLGSLCYALWRAHRLETDRRRAWEGLKPLETEGDASAELTADGLFQRPFRAMLALGVPSALTFTLMSVEGFAINGVLASFEESTAAIAAYAIYHRATMITLMPVIATGVAVLPFVARLVGERRFAEVRGGLRQAFFLSAGYLLLLAGPACLLGGDWVARQMSENPATGELASFAVRYAVPLAALAAVPFLLSRPAFEAVQRGAPGLIMAGLRYLLGSVPLALLGAYLAGRWGYSPFVGLLLGLITGTALISGIFAAWLAAMLRGLGAESPATQG